MGEPIATLLGEVPFFANLSESERQVVGGMGKVETRPANEQIFSEGEPASNFYVILEGTARLHKKDRNGAEIELPTLTQGKVFGEVALLDGAPQPASVSTLEPCELFVLSSQILFALQERFPGLLKAHLAGLSAGMRELQDQIASQAAEPAPEGERGRFEFLIQVASKVIEAHNVQEALKAVVDQVCAFNGWPVGHAYLVEDAASQKLVSSAVWYLRNTERYESLRQATELATFGESSELLQRVMASHKMESASLASGTLAGGLGLSAAFAFPVLLRNEVVAILEFFADQPGAPGELFVQTMLSLGLQLGRAIERKRWEERLIHDAYHDPLTGLLNRALFLDRLALCVEQTKRHPDYMFAVLFVDLDEFKQVNDGMGHAVGDCFLLEIAKRLLSSVRTVDSVARFGGDEFAILLDDLQQVTVVPRTIERIRLQLSHPINLEDRDLFPSASIGIALSSTGYESNEDVLRDADIAMYRAKSEGRGKVQVFDKSMHEQAIQLLHLETDLRQAIKEKELSLHYQPLVSMASDQIVGFEALVRWSKQGGNLIGPGAFLPMAEQSGLIIPLTEWVIREGCRQLLEWQAKFWGTSKLYISLNLSPSFLALPDLVEKVGGLITECKISPSQVVLEITESQVIQDMVAGSNALMQLSDSGIRIHVDDFGTGYSSLSNLAKLRVNALKIDRSLVNKIPADLRSSMIVRTIITLGHNLGLEVVAEGVETAEQKDFLRELKCDAGQGYWFHKPQDPEAISNLLLQQKPLVEKDVGTARLRCFNIFAELTDPELEEIAQSCEGLTVKTETVMIRQGQVGQDVFLLEEGEVGVYKDERDPTKYTAVLKAPNIFGERALMDPERIRTANVRAVTELKVFAIRITTLLVFLRRHPLLGTKIKQLIDQRLRRVAESS